MMEVLPLLPPPLSPVCLFFLHFPFPFSYHSPLATSYPSPLPFPSSSLRSPLLLLPAQAAATELEEEEVECQRQSSTMLSSAALRASFSLREMIHLGRPAKPPSSPAPLSPSPPTPPPFHHQPCSISFSLNFLTIHSVDHTVCV